ncbi:MAG: acetylxylan esterase [Chloroflexi bacterium]|nr:acetylxylan esterase [Chloroflexota bacterium]
MDRSTAGIGPAEPETALGARIATHELLRSLVEATPSQLSLPETVQGPDALRAWQRALREALWPVLGVREEPPAEVAVEIAESVACDGYTRHHVRYAGAFGGTVTAYLLVPSPRQAAPAPGLLCLHGHGGNLGKAHVAGVPPDDEAAAYAARLNYDFGVRFARRGYVTLAPDALGFGERAPDKSGGYHTAMGLVAEYLGMSLVGLRLLDDRRGLAALASRPEVDAVRLGAVGLSEGGKRTLFLAAFDERVRAAVVSGYFTSLRREVVGWRRLHGWDLCNHLFGLLRVCDLPEVAALAAPRALLIQNGRRDPLYGIEEVEAGFATVERAYRAAGAPAACALDLFDGEHVFMPPAAEQWFERYLGA